MKRRLFAAILALTLLASCARAEYWSDITERPVVCCDGRTGCQLLQMVMMGTFADLNPHDGLETRVLSAVYPLLLEITEEEFAHFSDEFRVEPEVIRIAYYIALGNCLWADILTAANVEESAATARRILLLFLDPGNEKDARKQILTIRRALTPELIEQIADNAGLPKDFVEYVMTDDHWRSLVLP